MRRIAVAPLPHFGVLLSSHSFLFPPHLAILDVLCTHCPPWIQQLTRNSRPTRSGLISTTTASNLSAIFWPNIAAQSPAHTSICWSKGRMVFNLSVKAGLSWQPQASANCLKMRRLMLSPLRRNPKSLRPQHHCRLEASTSRLQCFPLGGRHFAKHRSNLVSRHSWPQRATLHPLPGLRVLRRPQTPQVTHRIQILASLPSQHRGLWLLPPVSQIVEDSSPPPLQSQVGVSPIEVEAASIIPEEEEDSLPLWVQPEDFSPPLPQSRIREEFPLLPPRFQNRDFSHLLLEAQRRRHRPNKSQSVTSSSPLQTANPPNL